MKKIILLIAYSLLLIVMFSNIAFAQETATESAKNNYQLPFPGLLPDNPLYSLKVFRDRIIEFLIADPIKKAEFDLLSADKRLAIGIALFDKKKYELSETTISKGENYFEDGIKNLGIARREGRQIDTSLLVAFDSSARKHKEILEGIVVRASGETKKKLTKSLKRVTEFVEMVNKLKL